MKLQLILLDTPIIVSDEKIEEKDLICFVDLENNFVIEVCKNTDNYNIDTKKVIAGLPKLPQIDFNGFEEQLGIVDVEKLAYEKFQDDGKHNNRDWQAIGFIKGFKYAQKLNEKKFSFEDLRKAFEAGQLDKSNNWYSGDFNQFIQSLSKPKVFDIEVEMEQYTQNYHKDIWYDRPKTTDNKIKIIKIN